MFNIMTLIEKKYFSYHFVWLLVWSCVEPSIPQSPFAVFTVCTESGNKTHSTLYRMNADLFDRFYNFIQNKTTTSCDLIYVNESGITNVSSFNCSSDTANTSSTTRTNKCTNIPSKHEITFKRISKEKSSAESAQSNVYFRKKTAGYQPYTCVGLSFQVKYVSLNLSTISDFEMCNNTASNATPTPCNNDGSSSVGLTLEITLPVTVLVVIAVGFIIWKRTIIIAKMNNVCPGNALLSCVKRTRPAKKVEEDLDVYDYPVVNVTSAIIKTIEDDRGSVKDNSNKPDEINGVEKKSDDVNGRPSDDGDDDYYESINVGAMASRHNYDNEKRDGGQFHPIDPPKFTAADENIPRDSGNLSEDIYVIT
ncbi:unnamed protein product [Lymnaea stagnalis]|uniref:Uncharacterized protein n=1 Tax=Lymnaea stagnalis TaxID=6523 RepID=A0AAV2I4S4_LYMST